MLNRYLNDTSGQFAIMFAGAATMLLLAGASAIDIIGMQKDKSQLQSMTDAAVLAAAAAKTDKVAEIKSIVDSTIAANNLLHQDIQVNVKVVGELISVTGTAQYDTQLMGMLGVSDVPISSTSEAPIPRDAPVNIALVLDSTASMSGANMDALKSASKQLLQVFDAADPGSVQAGVVPYNRYVNVGMDNRNRSSLVRDQHEAEIPR